MIKITKNDLYTLYDSMKNLEKIPMKPRKLKKYFYDYTIIYNQYKIIEEQRIEIIKRYAQLDEEGNLELDKNNNIKILDNYLDECRVELNKLGNETVELSLKKNFYKDYVMTIADFLIIRKLVKK